MIAVAFCPHPPLLVQGVDVSGVPELVDVRAASLAAVASVLEREPRRVVVLGDGPDGVAADESAGGTFAGYGPDVRVGGPEGRLPLSLSVGCWLLDAAGWDGPRLLTTGDVTPGDDDVVLAMGDGSARRSLAAPGHLDDRAAAFDAHIADALAGGDGAALAALEVDLGAALLAAGTRTFVRVGRLTRDLRVDARLRLSDAPLGVGMFVADWTVR